MQNFFSINRGNCKENRDFFAMSPIMAIFAKNIPRLRTCTGKTSNKENDREHGKTAEKD